MTSLHAAPAGAPGLRSSHIRGIRPMDLVAGVLLSVGVFVLVHVDLYASDPHGNVIKAVAATSMTLPVVWARRNPLAAASVAAAGATVNWLLIGQYVRCGAAVPAALWLACAIGLRLTGRRALLAMILVFVELQALCLADAALIPASTIPLVPMATAFWFAGRAIRSHNDNVRLLDAQNRQLAATREQTARLAVDNDRQRISESLEHQLRRRIGDMSATAASGRVRVDDPASAQEAFGAIAREGRETLAMMRDVVDELREDAPRLPAPDLARLSDLVTHHGGSLTVDGRTRQLPGGFELTTYRVAEQLLHTFPIEAGPIDVQVHFGDDALELSVTGRQAREPVGPEVASARHRVELFGGSLTGGHRADQLQWIARLPLPAG